MIFVIGGKYNNKLQFALNKFNLNKDDVYDAKSGIDYNNQKVVYNFHEIIRLHINKGVSQKEIFSYLDKLLKNENIIIIADEVGYGIVPLDKEDRIFREEFGRVCSYVASKADEVYRVMYGIGNKIKG